MGKIQYFPDHIGANRKIFRHNFFYNKFFNFAQIYESQHCKGLQELHVIVDKKCLEHSYEWSSRQTCFYDF